MKKKRSLKHSILVGLIIALIVVVYAYGFQVTKVNFEKTRSEDRLTQLTRIIRALAHPYIFDYDKTEVPVETPVYLPCPDGRMNIPEPDTSGPYLVLDPACGDPKEFIMVYGYNFEPGSKGPVNFIPPSGASLTLGSFVTDDNGEFEVRIKLPKRQPVEEAQTIRAIARVREGPPHFSGVAKATWDKIIETVFLAFLATTIGTALAIPISFLAARNLMSEIKSPVTSVALSILGWLIGIWIGILIANWLATLRDEFTQNIWLTIGGVIILPVVAFFFGRWSISQDEEELSSLQKYLHSAGMIIALVGAVFAIYLLSSLMYLVGNIIEPKLGAFGFLGYFVAQLGEVLRMITPVIIAFGAGMAMGGWLSKFGLIASERLNTVVLKFVNMVIAALAGAALFALIGAGINWLYQIDNLTNTFYIPALIGAFLGAFLSLKTGPKDLLPIGSVVYLLIRTLLNATRSVEPLVMVIIFVVWVGIGPFAGSLALALHTIAALSKLYSEQVESISQGPLEAIKATGANRIQTIVFAVVPRIIPPYISFTMYRWDINVRMSTIIGFAGGGGIGFLLQQNINLLDYRAAAVQMLAIAVVVATMDYTSALIREKFV